jgi:hypothetical protein
VLVIRSTCANCGSETASRSARREGKKWFCSQSCLLHYESKQGRSTFGGGGRQSSKARTGRTVIAPVRLVGKIIKWAVIATVLVVVAGVVAVVVGLGKAADKSEKSSHRAALEIAHIRRGMSAAHVRRLLGKPDDTETYREGGSREVCWYYGSLLSSKEYEFCFRHWRLYSKSRVAL